MTTATMPKTGVKTPKIGARVPESIVNAARQRDPLLENADNSLLIRVALLVLAGWTVSRAVQYLGNDHPGKVLTGINTT